MFYKQRIMSAFIAVSLVTLPLACQVEDETRPHELVRDADLDFADVVDEVDGNAKVMLAYNDEDVPVSRMRAERTAGEATLILEIVDDAGNPARLVQTIDKVDGVLTIDAETSEGRYHWSGDENADFLAGFTGIPGVFTPHLELWAKTVTDQPELAEHPDLPVGYRSTGCTVVCYVISAAICGAVGAGSGGVGGWVCGLYAAVVCDWQCSGS